MHGDSAPNLPAGSAPGGPASDAARVGPRLDAEGVYRVWGRYSVGVVVTYAILLVVILVVLVPREPASFLWVPYGLTAVIVFFLARYFSTRYSIDDEHLRATRILGGRRIPLDEIRRIEYSALRDLAPSGMAAALGPWGWHGRMWSPVIGHFDSVFTDPSRGLLVTGPGNPLFLTPADPEAFARELSRRVRSYTGPLEKDVGHPGAG